MITSHKELPTKTLQNHNDEAADRVDSCILSLAFIIKHISVRYVKQEWLQHLEREVFNVIDYQETPETISFFKIHSITCNKVITSISSR